MMVYFYHDGILEASIMVYFWYMFLINVFIMVYFSYFCVMADGRFRNEMEVQGFQNYRNYRNLEQTTHRCSYGLTTYLN